MEVIISPAHGSRFDSIVTKKPGLAKFHTPSCPYCIELEPIWKKLLQTPEITKLNIPFLNVHADALQHITSKCGENIDSVPTIMIVYNNGNFKKVYKKGNDLNEIIKFIIENKQLFTQNGGSKYKNTRRKNTRRKKQRRTQKRHRRKKQRRSQKRQHHTK
jgi:thiol-disulfide isomerase/thioredoxin